jgi:hypothetical protein
LLCSPDDLVDGNDPPCDGETFTLSDYPSGVWVYLWPETDVNKVFFLLNGKIRVRELYAPYELLGGSPLITIGTHTVETEVILKGGETLTLPPVTFTLTEEGDIYNLLCSPDDVVDGSDPQCQGGTFSDQLWVYLWPETDVKRVIFLLDHTTLRKEWHAPYELLKGDPLTRHGDHIVETEVILDGGESIRLPDVTFDLN